MPFNGSGTFLRLRSWVSDAAASIKIKADLHDSEDDNFRDGLTNCITRDGQTQPSANIPMNGKRLINLGAATAASDAVTLAQLNGLKTFSEAIDLTGIDAKGRINFTGTQSPNTDANNRPLGLSFAQADLFFGVKPGGYPAVADIPRWIWNDHPDGTGNDIMWLTDTAILNLKGPGSIYAETHFRRDSKVASDTLGVIRFYGKDSSDAEQQYAYMAGYVSSPTANTENGRLDLGVISNGTFASAINIIGGAAGVANVTIPSAFAFKSSNAELTTLDIIGAVQHFYNPKTGDGSASGINYIFDRDSPSPATGDVLASIYFRGRDSTAQVQEYTRIQGMIDNPTAGSEEGKLVFIVTTGGTPTTKAQVTGDGLLCGTFYGGASVTLGTFTDTASTIYLRPNGHNVTTRQTTIDGATGQLSVGGPVEAAGAFKATSTTAILATGAAGTIYLRPSGSASTTGQAFLSSSGNFDLTGLLHADSNASFGLTDSSQSTAQTGVICAATGTIFSKKSGTASQTMIQFMNNALVTPTAVGTITTNGSATAYNTSSDETLKTFIGPLSGEDAIAIIRADPARRFTWNLDGKAAVGWGAQTSYVVSDDLASPPPAFEPSEEFQTEPQPGEPGYQPWGMDQGKRTPYLWAALSWALDRIDELTADVAALKGTPA